MRYIYHLKPNPFIGNSLIPLNSMDRDSDLYRSHAQKYLGREHLMLEEIPVLSCRWNDVVQFSAIDPKIILCKLKEIFPNTKVIRAEYFKISIEQVIPKYEVALFQRNPLQEKGNFKIYPEDIKILKSPDDFQELHEVPKRTLQYWEEVKLTNDKPLWFPYIPHIFIKGNVDTTDFQVCELRND